MYADRDNWISFFSDIPQPTDTVHSSEFSVSIDFVKSVIHYDIVKYAQKIGCFYFHYTVKPSSLGERKWPRYFGVCNLSGHGKLEFY